MENIRCLLADIPSNLLADILQQISESRPGVELIGIVDHINDLVEIVRTRDIDVLMFGMDAGCEIQTLNDIFRILPKVLAIGIMNDGRRICLCMEDIGPEILFGMTRERMKYFDC